MELGAPQPFCSSAEGSGCRSSESLMVFCTLGMRSSLHCQPAQQKGERHHGQLKASRHRFCRVQKCLKSLLRVRQYSQKTNVIKYIPPQTNINMYEKEDTVLFEGCSNLFETGLDEAALRCLIYNDETDDAK